MMEPSSDTFQYNFITILLVAFSFLNFCMCPLWGPQLYRGVVQNPWNRAALLSKDMTAWTLCLSLQFWNFFSPFRHSIHSSVIFPTCPWQRLSFDEQKHMFQQMPHDNICSLWSKHSRLLYVYPWGNECYLLVLNSRYTQTPTHAIDVRGC